MKLLKHIFLVLFLCVFNIQYARADEASAIEYKVKAVVLVNFAKYVQWPETTFSDPKQEIQVCILGDNPFGDVFTSPEAPKEAQGRPLKVLELSKSATPADASRCQLLFWTDKYASQAKSLVESLKDKPILTVSDEQDDSSLVSFTIEDGKVRFSIRHKSAKQHGLTISSQLLKLANLIE